MTDRILAFYRGGPDDKGRTLTEILAWEDRRLENAHDYVQWVFPNRTRSRYNPAAPLLTDETVKAFRTDPTLKARLLQSASRMDTFYADGPEKPLWVSDSNHNYLRITRILLCLNELGLSDRARQFFDDRRATRDRWAREPGSGPMLWWKAAVEGRER